MKKGLIVKSPWIEKIFEGTKTWEIRNKDVHYRGKIYLIKSGTGHIYGECYLIDSKKLTLDEFIKNIDKHHVDDISLLKYPEDKIYAWIIDKVKLYEKPIAYRHPRGAIIWVNLDKEENIIEQIPE